MLVIVKRRRMNILKFKEKDWACKLVFVWTTKWRQMGKNTILSLALLQLKFKRGKIHWSSAIADA